MGSGSSKKGTKELPSASIPLYGPGNSGKSTFFNQIRVKRLGGFSEEKRAKVLGNVRDRILFWTQTLGISEDFGEDDPLCGLGLTPQKDVGASFDLKEDSQIVMGGELDLFSEGDEEKLKDKRLDMLKVLSRIWAPGSEAKAAFDSLVEHHEKCESDIRILGKAQSFCKPDYDITDEDILHFRLVTTGEGEPLTYCHENQVNMVFVDVGGQRAERKHWGKVKDPAGVVFVAAIDCYNRKVNEGWLGGYDEKVAQMNALEDAVELFGGIAKQCLESDPAIPLVLLLNKEDLFKKNILKGDLGTHFPDFKGGSDVENAKKFVKNLFVEEAKKVKDELDMIHIHFISLVDGTAAETILNSIQSMIVCASFDAEGL